MYSDRKYRINELLDSLPVRKNKVALSELPGILKVSLGTWNNYRTIRIGEVQDIPAEKVDILERFFEIGPGELKNYTPTDIPTISELCKDGDESPEPTAYGFTK